MTKKPLKLLTHSFGLNIYKLEGDDVWIEVNETSIHIKKNEESASVTIHPSKDLSIQLDNWPKRALANPTTGERKEEE